MPRVRRQLVPRDYRSATAHAVAEAPASAEGQRLCSRGQWCQGRTVTVINGERVTAPALCYQAFCRSDWDLIGNCLRDLPGIYLRLEHELAQPAVTEANVHVPFGPSVPVRLDVDAAMRLTAALLAMWESRVRTAKYGSPRPPAPVVAPGAVRDAAQTLTRNLSVLLALQPGWMTHNVSLHPGRHGQPASISDAILDEHGDAEIVRVGADFIGLFIQRDGAAAGLEILHLHYWDRAVLRETPARPEELIGVECRACSLRALRRAEPAWFTGDPGYYSQCAECGDLMSEDDYHMWVGQLHAYERARLAATPVLGAPPAA
jgi:hypothetical protein